MKTRELLEACGITPEALQAEMQALFDEVQEDWGWTEVEITAEDGCRLFDFVLERIDPRLSGRTERAAREFDAAMRGDWRMERDYDAKNGTHRLTNGRAQLSIWTAEVEDADLEALEEQLERGRRT